jgi:hypothetical protein
MVELESGETLVDTGREWIPGEPVRIRVRRRAHWTEIDDRGEALRRAGKPPGWLEIADRILAEEGMNVNRAGVVFVTYGDRAGHDLETITGRLADSALDVYNTLLELQQ